MTETNQTRKRPALVAITYRPTGEKRAYYFEDIDMSSKTLDGIVARFIEEDDIGNVRRYPLERQDDMHIAVHFMCDKEPVGIFDEEEVEEDFV